VCCAPGRGGLSSVSHSTPYSVAAITPFSPSEVIKMSFQKMPFLARCAWLTLAFVHTAYASSCYYPGGGLATDFDYVPCTGSKFSSCCIPSEGDVCLSNGLCYWNDAPYVFRGACTGRFHYSFVDHLRRLLSQGRPDVEIKRLFEMVRCRRSRYVQHLDIMRRHEILL
jgi:hypothetical protein